MSENIRQFIDQLAAGQNAEAKDTLENELAGRSFAALDEYKKEIAKGIFGGNQESEVEQEEEFAMEEEVELDEASDKGENALYKMSRDAVIRSQEQRKSGQPEKERKPFRYKRNAKEWSDGTPVKPGE
jgi:hypothetical protein